MARGHKQSPPGAEKPRKARVRAVREPTKTVRLAESLLLRVDALIPAIQKTTPHTVTRESAVAVLLDAAIKEELRKV
jgi:hypothetical protein